MPRSRRSAEPAAAENTATDSATQSFSGGREDGGQQEVGEEPGAAATEPRASSVPSPEIEALRAELQAEREARARLEGQVSTLATVAAPKEPEKPKEFTRVELRTAVDNGTISEDKMFEILEEQAERRVEARLATKLEERLSANQSQTRVQTELDKYVAAYPGLNENGHPDRERANREYAYLISIGQPKGPATELAACRAVFGPTDKVRETTRQSRERHVETGGAGSPPGDDGSASWQKGLTRDQISYGSKMFEMGQWTGPDDPKAQRYFAIARGGDPKKLAQQRHRQSERRVTH